VTRPVSDSSLRQLYLQWVEETIEDYKESIPRSELIQIAEDVIHRLDVTRRGQYQLTELLLLEEVDRAIYRLLKLPGYRRWAAEHCSRPELALDFPRPVVDDEMERVVIDPIPARAASF
jgi:hypothetical protein